MELSKLGIGYSVYYEAQVLYGPYSMIRIGPHGIFRYTGISTNLSFVGDNGAVKVLRSRCEEYPQNFKWMLPGAIEQKAFGGQIVTVNGVLYYIHIHDDNLPYFMASYHVDVDTRLHTSTLGRLTDDGLQLCAFVDKRAGVALDHNEKPLVWRVK